MNDVRVMTNIHETDMLVPLGTMVRLKEQASGGHTIYMLVEKEWGKALLINLYDGRVWGYEGVVSHEYSVEYNRFKSYCEVEFEFIDFITVKKESK